MMPGTVGEDGRPKAVEHVLEFRDRILAERGRKSSEENEDDES